MAVLTPFRALRPVPEAAARVAAVPYDVVTTDEARALADGNPLSFLHVSRAEIDLPSGTDPHADVVYDKAAANFRALTLAAPLVVEDTTSLYIYRLRANGHEQTGIAGCYSLDEYDRDAIRKHERTRRDKEDDRTRHMVGLRAQTGPVFLTYRAIAAIDGRVRAATSAPPLIDLTAPDGVSHTIWRLADRDAQALIEAVRQIPALYIADGHHRAASAARARQQLRGHSAQPVEADTFFAVAFPDDQVRILPYNRVVKDLGTHDARSFLARLREHYEVREGGATMGQRGDVGMYLDDRWYHISLGAPPPDADPAKRLDVSRLQDSILTPLLGIGDVRTDRRIDFVGGARGTAALEQLVNSGAAAVAFAMYPVSVAELMAISDAGEILPPKSTWFEPKLRDGLLSHVI